MIKERKEGVTLAELLIATFIAILVIVISLEVSISMNKNAKILIAYLGSYLRGREVIDIISKDCRIAIRVMDYFAGYVTTDDCLVLKVPSIDSLGNIIDVNHEFDHIIYRIDNGDLWKTVMPGVNSSRPAYDGIFKKNIESLYVSSAGQGLSSIAHKSSVTYLVLWAAIAEDVLGKPYRVSTGTTVKLMNYEWEYVR